MQPEHAYIPCMTETSPSLLQRAITTKGVFWLTLLMGLVSDIATKAWADIYVRPTDPHVTQVIPGVFGWKWATNEGAAFSIMHGRPVLLAAIACIVLLVLLGYVVATDPKRRAFLVALGLVASGAIGNLYDRMLLGHVRDFAFFTFDLPLHGTSILGFTIPQRWPVWNVADAWIMLGVAMLLVMSFRKQPKPEKAPDAA